LLVFGTPAQGKRPGLFGGGQRVPGGRGDGVPVTSLIELEPGTRPAHYFAGAADVTLMLANAGGFGLLANAGDMHGRNKAGKAFLSVADGDALLPPAVVAAGHAQVACLAQDAGCCSFRSTS